MKKLKNQAFTLVELIVVITILAILGTIAFISFQGYSLNARDGVRLADINSIKKSLELFIIEKGFYPTPDNQVPKTYEGGLAWTQGTVGDNVITNLVKISKKPTDPLLGNEYTYSVTNAKTEYQLGAIYEGGSILGNNDKTLYTSIISQTNAATEKKATAMVTGTYNGKFLKLSTGGLDYILAVPSIIDSDITSSIIIPRNLVYDNYQNLPNSYKNLGYTMTGGFDYSPTTIVVFTGVISDLTSSGIVQEQLITNLQTVYQGTIIQSEPGIQEILNATTSAQQQILVGNYINNSVGGITGVNTVQTQTQTFLSNCTGSLQYIYTDAIGTEIGRVSNTGATLSGNPGALTCLGNIIVCAGTNSGYTLAACNVGSIVAGTDRTISSGKYFQWGNNYGSISSGPTITSLADATGYGPDNYYTSTGFIIGSITYGYDWTIVKNDNLWGSGGTVLERQGPCEIGYHIPTQPEWASVITTGGWTTGGAMQIALKLPYAGSRGWDGVFSTPGSRAYYWTSTPNGTNGTSIYFRDSSIYPNNPASRSFGDSIRCFKN